MNITSLSTVSRWDHKLSYLPIVSTAINLTDIFIKAVLYCVPNSRITNKHLVYLKQKSLLRCVVLLVPFLGNIGIVLYDLAKLRTARNRINQNSTEILKQAWDHKLGRGTSKNDQAAFALFLKAAEKGELVAMVQVATAFMKGEGTVKDDRQGFEWYAKAAEKGSLTAMMELSNAYEAGIGVTKDLGKAFEWLEKAAQKGHTPAMKAVGKRYAEGIGISKDLSKAFAWYKRGADQDDIEAQLLLGDCYNQGRGVIQDKKRAFEIYQQAAQTGNGQALLRVGRCYNDGLVIAKNYLKARDCFKKAADKNITEAMVFLGSCYIMSDTKKGLEWFEKAAAMGDSGALYELGTLYHYGLCVTLDDAKSLSLLLESAQKGNPHAMVALAKFHSKGNKQKYVEWYEKASESQDITVMREVDRKYCLMDEHDKRYAFWKKHAETGHLLAKAYLGGFFFGGYGVAIDKQKAVELWQEAEDSQEIETIKLLTNTYLNYLKDPAKMVAFLKKQAERGCSYAMIRLGNCYLEGFGSNPQPDPSLAFKWYLKAAETGGGGADDIMATVALAYKHGKGIPKSRSKAFYWFKKYADVTQSDNAFGFLGLCYKFGYGTTQDTQKATELLSKSSIQQSSYDDDYQRFSSGMTYKMRWNKPNDLSCILRDPI